MVDFIVRAAFIVAGLAAGFVIVDAAVRGWRAWQRLRRW